jgi:putative transposase
LNDSFRFPDPKSIQVENRRIKLPKLGWIGFHKSQSIEGTIKNATITRCAGE